MNYKNIEEWSFCDNKKSSNKLFRLVKEGKKTATSYLYTSSYNKDEKFSILTNWDKSEKLLIETISSQVVKFKDITEQHAYNEGEGNRTLKYWKKVHKKFFTRILKQNGLQFNQDIKIVCENFKVIKNLNNSIQEEKMNQNLNNLTDYEKIAKIWQIELNMEYLKPERNVRLSFKDIGPFAEYLAINYLPDYHGGGSGGMGFDLINQDQTKAFEVKSCCTIQNAKCNNVNCMHKFNNLFSEKCPICQSTDFNNNINDSRFGINAKETLSEIESGIFAGFMFCHLSKIEQKAEETTLIIKAEWYTLDFNDPDIREIQLDYLRNQASNGRQAHCNLLPNKIDFYKLCPFKIKEVVMNINYADLNETPTIIEKEVNEFPQVPISILNKGEQEKFKSLSSYNPETQTADCKDFTLNMPYRNKSLGKERGDTRANMYKRIKKQSN